MIKIINGKMYMKLEKYEISQSVDFYGKKGKEKTVDITFPIEVNEFKNKIKKSGFEPAEVGSTSCDFNMFVGWNEDEMPLDKALTDYNLIALVFEDINKMTPKQRLSYEQSAGINNSFLYAAAEVLEKDEDAEYFYNVIDNDEFFNQELRQRISEDYESRYYLAGVIRRSLEIGKDYFSEDVIYF